MKNIMKILIISFALISAFIGGSIFAKCMNGTNHYNYAVKVPYTSVCPVKKSATDQFWTDSDTLEVVCKTCGCLRTDHDNN